MSEIVSPCVLICSIDEKTGYCFGCGRTRDEVAGWLDYSHDERLRIMEGLSERLSVIERKPRRITRRKRMRREREARERLKTTASQTTGPQEPTPQAEATGPQEPKTLVSKAKGPTPPEAEAMPETTGPQESRRESQGERFSDKDSPCE